MPRNFETGDPNSQPTKDQFINFLQSVGNHSYKLKAFPRFLQKRFLYDLEQYIPPSPTPPTPTPNPWHSIGVLGGWKVTGNIHTYQPSDSVLRNYDSPLPTMIAAVNNSSSAQAGLGGWMLEDEPYGGIGASKIPDYNSEISYTGSRPPDTWFLFYNNMWWDLVTQLGLVYPYSGNDRTNQIRDDIYYRMKYINQQLQLVWDTSNDHPIHCIIRAYGNYVSQAVDPGTNFSARISHVLHDDHYIPWNGEPGTAWRDSTEGAIQYLVSSSFPPNSFVQWFDGMAFNNNGTKWVASDQYLRYAVYSAIVHGARGVMFWSLSKSEQEAFMQAEKIANEVKIMVPYLLNSPSELFNWVYLTTSQYGTADVDFLIRLHPTDPNKALVIIVNQSTNEFPAIWINNFPSTWQYSSAVGILPGYNWSYEPYDTNGDGKYDKLGIGTGEWWARAFILTKAN